MCNITGSNTVTGLKGNEAKSLLKTEQSKTFAQQIKD
jgi:hypothetical protein